MSCSRKLKKKLNIFLSWNLRDHFRTYNFFMCLQWKIMKNDAKLVNFIKKSMFVGSVCAIRNTSRRVWRLKTLVLGLETVSREFWKNFDFFSNFSASAKIVNYWNYGRISVNLDFDQHRKVRPKNLFFSKLSRNNI